MPVEVARMSAAVSNCYDAIRISGVTMLTMIHDAVTGAHKTNPDCVSALAISEAASVAFYQATSHRNG